MSIQCWGILISTLSIVATAGLGYYFYRRTTNMTKELKEFFTTLIINTAPDSKTLQRLLDDHKNTGVWRGRVEQIPGKQGFRIAWRP